MLRRIMEGKYDFPSPDWDTISESAKDLISKMLTVDPDIRLTAKQALSHPFFEQVEDSCRYCVKPFNARRKFRVAISAVLASVRMVVFHRKQKPLLFTDALRDPYAIKHLRKIIDASAFRIYGHWVKKAADQNRAALFENSSRVNQKRVFEIESENAVYTLSSNEAIARSSEHKLVAAFVH